MATDEEELRLKSYEVLLEYSKNTLDFYFKRWDEADNKVGRFITMLVALFGAGVFSLDRVLAMFNEAPSGGHLPFVFLVGYGTFIACGLTAFGFFIAALSYQSYRSAQTDDALVVPYFEQRRYVDILVGLSRSYLSASAGVDACLRRSQRVASWGYGFFVATVFFGLMTAATYVILQRGTRDDRRTTVTTSTTPAASTSTAPYAH